MMPYIVYKSVLTDCFFFVNWSIDWLIAFPCAVSQSRCSDTSCQIFSLRYVNEKAEQRRIDICKIRRQPGVCLSAGNWRQWRYGGTQSVTWRARPHTTLFTRRRWRRRRTLRLDRDNADTGRSEQSSPDQRDVRALTTDHWPVTRSADLQSHVLAGQQYTPVTLYGRRTMITNVVSVFRCRRQSAYWQSQHQPPLRDRIFWRENISRLQPWAPAGMGKRGHLPPLEMI